MTVAAVSKVCPFSHDSGGVASVSSREDWESLQRDPIIGRYRSIYTGRVADQRRILGSSSGGLTTWILRRLLSDGAVDGVIHVAPRAALGDGDDIFGYRVSRTVAELDEGRKSHYYATTYVDAVNHVRGDGKSYAFVGVSCFVTSMRMLMREDPQLAEQIRYCIGLVCGHLKTQEYAASLAWQLGVAPADLQAVDFRVKRPDRPVTSYAFGARAFGETETRTRLNRDLVGTNWGHTAFQLKACDYCDDIFAEAADLVFADAWLPQFSSVWQGTNLVVVRDRKLGDLLEDGARAGEIDLTPTDRHAAAAAQAGNVRHRRTGLATRLQIDRGRGRWVPYNRSDDLGLVAFAGRRRHVVRLRRSIARQSIQLFARARRSGHLAAYLVPMRALIVAYRVSDRLARRSSNG